MRCSGAFGGSARITHRPQEWLPHCLPGLLTESASEEIVEHTLSLMCVIHPEASLTMLRAMADADLRDVVPTIKCQLWYCTVTSTPVRRSRLEGPCTSGSADQGSSYSQRSAT